MKDEEQRMLSPKEADAAGDWRDTGQDEHDRQRCPRGLQCGHPGQAVWGGGWEGVPHHARPQAQPLAGSGR